MKTCKHEWRESQEDDNYYCIHCLATAGWVDDTYIIYPQNIREDSETEE